MSYSAGIIEPKENHMKKLLILAVLATALGGCVGLVDGRSKTTGETIHDVYFLHPIISTKYIARA